MAAILKGRDRSSSAKIPLQAANLSTQWQSQYKKLSKQYGHSGHYLTAKSREVAAGREKEKCCKRGKCRKNPPLRLSSIKHITRIKLNEFLTRLGSKAYFELGILKRLLKRSTRPPVSTTRCLPV